MKNLNLNVTREVDIESLYNDLRYCLPECDELEQAGITEDALDRRIICQLLKALAAYAEEEAGE